MARRNERFLFDWDYTLRNAPREGIFEGCDTVDGITEKKIEIQRTKDGGLHFVPLPDAYRGPGVFETGVRRALVEIKHQRYPC